MSKKKSLYAGVLNKPMEYFFASQGLLTKTTQAEASTRNMEQWTERLIALFEHYDVAMSDEGAGMTLALALARDHVPGFQYVDKSKRGRGRPGKWVGFKPLELYADVRHLMAQGHSANNACRILAENSAYAARYAGETQGNLHRRYLEALTNLEPPIQQMYGALVKKGGQEVVGSSIIATFALREK